MAARSPISPGERFGRLLVVENTDPMLLASGRSRHAVKAICDCGKIITVAEHVLRSGGKRSCNCLKLDVNRETMRRNKEANPTRMLHITHRQTGTASYYTWANMVQRCTNPKNSAYQNYGGRGISIHPKWMSFDGFYADMGDRPPGRSIDRIDVNGNYEPGNCRWATKAEQASNTRTTVFVAVHGQTLHLSEAARRLGVEVSRFYQKLRHGAASIQDAVDFYAKQITENA